jgi:hypothetical protein
VTPRHAVALAAALAALLTVLQLAPPARGAQATGVPGLAQPDPNALRGVTALDAKQIGRRLTGRRARALADALPKIRKERKRFPGSYSGVFLKGSGQWQISYYARGKPLREIGQVSIDDRSATVLEANVGFKVAWTMARGYPGAFGRKVNSPLVWITLSVLFLAPFLTPRRPWRMLHLDLLVLLAFSVSVAFFNDAQIDVSVPLVYPLLGYLLARMLWVGLRRGREEREARPLPLLVPVVWLAIAAVFLLGFRIGLNVTNSNVIDVGYAGVIGADRLADGDLLYGAFPKDNEHGDTYGPLLYESYVPFEQALPWDGTWRDLPAAHGAAIAFDVLCALLLLLIGRQLRGVRMGVVLAYAWLAFPFTLYVSNTNSNDALVAVFALLAVLVAASAPARGAVAALGGLTKFASLGLAPLLWTHGAKARGRAPALGAFAMAFAGATLIVLLPYVIHGDNPATVVDRTLGFQAERGSPFSVWGLYGLSGLQRVWQVVAVGLALGLAFVPRREDVVGLSACAAAILIALQLGVTHWFYLYIAWFFPLVMVALLCRYRPPAR